MAGLKCGKCNNKISRHEDNIICTGPCAAAFHIKCVNISVAMYMSMRTNGAAELYTWTCVLCAPNSSTNSSPTSGIFSGEVRSILPDNPSLTEVITILKNLLDENKNLQMSMTETHNKLDAQTQQLHELLARTKELENENSRLKEENYELRMCLDDQEQYSRRNCIEIHGIPEVKGENVLSEVVKTGRAIGINLKPESVDNCHRLGRQPIDGESPVVRGIIVKFVRNIDKQTFISCSKVKSNLNTSELGFIVKNTVFVNENLTKHRRSLMSRARKMKRMYDLAYVWSRNGNIYVREREKSKIIIIKSEKDLDIIERNCKEFAQRVLGNTDRDE